MTIPKGIKPVRKRLASGELRIYWYHRATGKRVGAAAGTAAALLEVEALDREAQGIAQAAAQSTAKTFALLWEEYHKSPEFQRLKPRTKRDYEAVREWIGAAATKAFPATMTGAQIVRLRDKAFQDKGRRFANYVVQVVRLVLEWGRHRGWLGKAANPAMGMKSIRKPKGERHQNRAWTSEEVRAFLQFAPQHLKLPLALGLFCAMREGDMVALTWRAYDGGAVRWRAGKNDEPCMAPATGVLRALLDAQPKTAVQVCTNTRGQPWKSESSFRSAFFDAVRTLQASGHLAKGTTFHGLRHTVGAVARDDGASEFQVAAAIGDRSTAMASVYGRDASRQAAQASVLEGVQKQFEGAKLSGFSVSNPE